MFDKWSRQEENPSWEKMIAALKDMDENNLASKLRKKYVQQQQMQGDAESRLEQTSTIVWQPRPFALLWKGLASVVSNSCTSGI